MGKDVTLQQHPDQSKLPLDISPHERFKTYPDEELESMLQEAWDRFESGNLTSEDFYNLPTEVFY